jgi:V8-like Glu-specific endopeptidase
VACQDPRFSDAAITTQHSDKKVIYGDDNRLDLFEVTNPLHLQLADSTVALIDSSLLGEAGEEVTEVHGENFGAQYGLCAEEPYREQNAAAFCSGSLIGPDLIMTAGHCVRSQSSCEQTRFVFGYAINKAGELPATLKNEDIYKCGELIHSEVETDGSDFALVRLSTPVMNHTPLAINKTAQDVKEGDPLLIVGHPAGLPAKVADGASVRRSRNVPFFVANLDSYGGNSGSPVFNAATGEIEGILVRGENDFVRKGNCNVSYRCADDKCRGEDVTKISTVLSYIPE